MTAQSQTSQYNLVVGWPWIALLVVLAMLLGSFAAIGVSAGVPQFAAPFAIAASGLGLMMWLDRRDRR